MSDKIGAAVPCAVQLDPTIEQLHRLHKWAFNPGNDKNPLALAVRTLFEERDRYRAMASNQHREIIGLKQDLAMSRSHLKQWLKRFGGDDERGD